MQRVEYQLDFTIERDTDRLKAVEQILDTLSRTPSNAELERFASYIMYGKDENGQNAIQRREIKDYDTKKFKDYKSRDEKNASLEELLENPLFTQDQLKAVDAKRVYINKNRTIQRPKYDKKTGELIDPGDSDIPGMVELWEAIDHLAHTLAANEGKVEFKPDDTVITDSVKLHSLKHMLIDVRRQQYYLKDAFKPVLKAQRISFAAPPPMRWDCDTAYWISLDEWYDRMENVFDPSIPKDLDHYEQRANPETGEPEVKWIVAKHNFDWENEWHIRQLIKFYGDIYMEAYDKLHSWARTLIFDFDYYFNQCGFTELREYVMTRFVDKATYSQIAAEILEKWGVSYSASAISGILNHEIPHKIAEQAARERQILETPDDRRKMCTRCKRILPASTIFFVSNKSKKFGLQSWCKQCDREERILRGREGAKDARSKDPTLPKMQARKIYY